MSFIGASFEDNHIKRKPCPSPWHEGKQFSLCVLGQNGADQAGWTQCLCPYGPKTFNNIWISPKTSRQMNQAGLWHHGRLRMFSHRHQNRNYQHWSHVVVLDESRVSLYESDHHAGEIHLFLPLAFHQHDWVEVTKQISSVPLFPIISSFSALSKHTLDIEYHVDIWQNAHNLTTEQLFQ